MLTNDKEKFSVFIPFDLIEKSGEDGKIEMKIKGVASTAKQDADEEILEPSGFNLDKFIKSGFINYHHLAHKDPSMIIGEPTSAFVKNNELHIEASLYPESEMAQKVYHTAQILQKSSKTRRLGFSIEGKALQRDPQNEKRIIKAMITGCAVTPSPKNPGTAMQIMKGGIDSMEFESDNKEFIIDVIENGIRYTIDKDLNFEKADSNELEKAGDPKGKGVIGKTESGKSIYENGKHSDYGNFHEYDHREASWKHDRLSNSARVEKNSYTTLASIAEEKGDKEETKNYREKAKGCEEKELHHAAQATYHSEESRPSFAKEIGARISKKVSDIRKAMTAGDITGTETTDKSLTEEPNKVESVEGGGDIRKKRKKEKKYINKSEVITDLKSTYGLDTDSSAKIFELAKGIDEKFFID